MTASDELRRATLAEVKAANGISGNYHDATLQVYFDTVFSYMINAGVPSSEITSGDVARGVSDMWYYGNEGAKFSEIFKLRVNQLSLKGVKHG